MRDQKLKSLTVKNFQGVTMGQFIIPENTPIYEVSGDNGAGKSSMLKGLEFLLYGKKVLSQKPVKTGAKKGVVIAETDDFIFEASVTVKGNATYKVTPRGGETYNNRGMIDELCGNHTIDPVEFINLHPKDQYDKLIRVSNIGETLDSILSEYNDLFAERRIQGRTVTNLKATFVQLDAPDPDSEYPEYKSIGDLQKKLIEEQAKDKVIQESDAKCTRIEIAIKNREKAISETKVKIADYEAKISILRAGLRIDDDALDEEELELSNETKKYESLPDADTDSVMKEMQEIETYNLDIQAKRSKIDQYKKAESEYRDAEKKHTELQTKMDLLQSQKAEAVKTATYPLPGLQADVENRIVLFDGLPFSQLSTAEQHIMACRIQLSSRPNLRLVVFKNASLIDETLRKEIYDHAFENGYTAIFESIHSSDLPGIVIEGGETK